MEPVIPIDPGRPGVSLVAAAGARVACRRRGRGRPIVCLHAVGHDARDFDGLAERLGHAGEIIAVDWPGHGDSPADPHPPGSRRYGAILAELLEALDLKDVVLLGNSVGGGAAIVTAAAQPERVAGLVLCDSSGLVGYSWLLRLICRRQARFFARGEKGDPSFASAYRRYYERTVLTGARAAARREEIIRAGSRLAPLLRQAWLGFGEPQADLRDLVTAVRCPVLIAWARRDRVIPWRFAKAGAKRFAQHRVERFEGSHSAFLEAPDAFDEALLRFLASLPKPADA